MQIVADHLDTEKHLLEIAGHRDLLDGIGEFSVLNPDSARAARVIAGHAVDAEADQFGEAEVTVVLALSDDPKRCEEVLESDKQLQVLNKEPDFQKLLAELKGKSQ